MTKLRYTLNDGFAPTQVEVPWEVHLYDRSVMVVNGIAEAPDDLTVMALCQMGFEIIPDEPIVEDEQPEAAPAPAPRTRARANKG